MNSTTLVDSPAVLLSLESVLQDPTSNVFNEFATYLTQSYCIENLYFWLATQEYHQSFQELSSRDKTTQQLCESMIGLYIRPNSPQEINIPCHMRQSILELYHTDNHPLYLFDDAAEAVLELMRVNSFLPWSQQQQQQQQQPQSNNSWSSSSSFSSSPLTTTGATPTTITTAMSKSFSSSSSITTCSTSTSTTTSTTKKQHKSWPSPASSSASTITTTTKNKLLNGTNLISSTSLSGLSSAAFSITDKWNLKHKVNHKQNSRRSCSSLDSFIMMENNDQDDDILSVPSVSSSSPAVIVDKNNTRYRSMLNRVKKSFLGGGDDGKSTTTATENVTSSASSSPLTTGTCEETTFWRKSQR